MSGFLEGLPPNTWRNGYLGINGDLIDNGCSYYWLETSSVKFILVLSHRKNTPLLRVYTLKPIATYWSSLFKSKIKRDDIHVMQEECIRYFRESCQALIDQLILVNH